MQGIAVGRAVDLMRFDGYDDLLKKLEEMFEINGGLCGSTKKWQVVYTDDEDDMMMVGDDPWQLSLCDLVLLHLLPFLFSCSLLIVFSLN